MLPVFSLFSRKHDVFIYIFIYIYVYTFICANRRPYHIMLYSTFSATDNTFFRHKSYICLCFLGGFYFRLWNFYPPPPSPPSPGLARDQGSRMWDISRVKACMGAVYFLSFLFKMFCLGVIYRYNMYGLHINLG